MKKIAVAGATAFVMAAMPLAGVFATDNIGVTDNLTITIADACTFERTTGNGDYTQTIALGQVETDFASSTFTAICNNVHGYSVSAAFTSLTGNGEAITYSATTPTGGSGTWTATVGENNLAATGAVLMSNNGVTSDSGDTETVNYTASVRNNQAQGDYTGTATYTLVQNVANAGNGD